MSCPLLPSPWACSYSALLVLVLLHCMMPLHWPAPRCVHMVPQLLPLSSCSHKQLVLATSPRVGNSSRLARQEIPSRAAAQRCYRHCYSLDTELKAAVLPNSSTWAGPRAPKHSRQLQQTMEYTVGTKHGDAWCSNLVHHHCCLSAWYSQG